MQETPHTHTHTNTDTAPNTEAQGPPTLTTPLGMPHTMRQTYKDQAKGLHLTETGAHSASRQTPQP